MTISLILMIVAIACLFMAAFNVAATRLSIGWLGLALWALSQVILI